MEIMSEIASILNRIERRLATIETVVAKTDLVEVVTRPAYSCNELSELTKAYGLQSYKPFTIRLACSDGRLADAEKRDNGNWAVPREAVLRVLRQGLPPERR